MKAVDLIRKRLEWLETIIEELHGLREDMKKIGFGGVAALELSRAADELRHAYGALKRCVNDYEKLDRELEEQEQEVRPSED